jgi:DNA-directed RNA polymerase III subunit RPC4
MPPKATARGRGRGRGGTARGAAPAAASRDAAQTPAANTAEPSPATASVANPPGPAPVPRMVVPVTSPSPILDAEIEPTMSKEPSSTPAPASSSRGSTTSKFKPKGVRRSETERARIAEEQLKIQEQRNAEEARRLARLNHGRGRGRGRGRGGFMRGNLRTSGAAGPLAAGMSCECEFSQKRDRIVLSLSLTHHNSRQWWSPRRRWLRFCFGLLRLR